MIFDPPCHNNPHGTFHCDCQTWSDERGTWRKCCWCGRVDCDDKKPPAHGQYRWGWYSPAVLEEPSDAE